MQYNSSGLVSPLIEATLNSARPITIKHQGQTWAGLAWGPADKAPWLAFHGWLDNAASFAQLATQLPDQHIIAVDLTGHGKSHFRTGEGAYLLWDYVADIRSILTGLNIEQASLMGHSLGAIVSAMYAGCYPEKVTRLILLDGLIPFTCRDEDTPQQLRKTLEQEPILVKSSRSYESIRQAVKVRQLQGKLSFEAAWLLTAYGLEPVTGGSYRWRYDSRLKLPSRWRLTEKQAGAFIQAIQAKLLLLVAEQGLFPDKLQQCANHWLAEAACIVVPGHHHFHLEQETVGKIADEVRHWLSE
ncbi:alpha/beta hydrolase [Spartinivicinus poritis]|uniref:Alpha/beta fold hydrolase n=1 Tax=Spartinivicinus poritis TaxID=2994640 RepID=A0ABT5U6T3_9GAMM|nr:alpha/beta fold hydrolase [Spartinivicinus sp. A2-2]MDE1461158.1 alpha/beta fold hydrolase [Spartinivicinus sp. A2-2]